MTSDDIAYLRLLADWHDRQARYLLLTMPVSTKGRFHFMAAARLSRLADEATMSRSGGGHDLSNVRRRQTARATMEHGYAFRQGMHEPRG
jgi:hypothetical protein